jgi:1-acyl-sn-glycerol-3-phosphate acyltransferase
VKKLDQFYDQPFKGNGVNGLIVLIKYVVGAVFKVCFRQTNVNTQIVSTLPDDRAVVIAGNHTSFTDPLLVLFACMPRHVRFIAKREIFRVPAFRRLLAWAGVMPVDREGLDQQAIKRAIRCLKSGESIGIFPEGTRVRKPGQASRAETGAASFAMIADVLIIPCGISGADRIRPYGGHFMRFPKITVRFGEPVDWHDFEFLPRRLRAQAITDELMRRIDALKQGEDPGPMPDLRARYASPLAQKAAPVASQGV